MSPDHHLSEHVYLSLKADLLSGALPSLRLNLASLEARYHSSATPVREALLRLVVERLVEFRKGGGFGISSPDADDIRQLYDINRRVLGLIRTWPGNRLSVDIATPLPDDIALATAQLFLVIASAVPNHNLPRLIANLNDRLGWMRSVEPLVIPNISVEQSALLELARSGEKKPLVAALDAYHRVRIRKAALIVRAYERRAQ